MKILKWVFAVAVVLLVAFFMIGVFVPTFTYVSTIEVDRPVSHAFAVFNDVNKMGDWMTGFKSIETISGQPNEVGSKYKLVIEENGEVMEMEETMTAFRENELFAFKLVNDVMFVDAEIIFSEQQGKTTITASNVVEGRNLVWKSLLALFKSSIEDTSQEMYDNLKQVIETSEPAMLMTGNEGEATASGGDSAKK